MEEQSQIARKSWIQRLKDESWEAELLVSAVAIFAILKSFSALDWLLIQFIDRLEPSQYDIGYFILVFGYLAIGILAGMFTIHFALRAYWIGLVGLNSVFPDYGLEDSAYSPIYTKKILRILPKIGSSITKVDELCSVIFSAAFAFMLIYLYGMITASIYLVLFNILDDFVPSWLLFIPIGVLGIIAILGVFISIPANMKKFHGNQTIQHLYYLYAHWGAILMYGPVYKSVFQITMLFGSNFKKKKGLVKMVLLMLIIGVFFGMTKLSNSNYPYLINVDRKPDKSRIFSEYYLSNNTNANFIVSPEIQSEIISNKTAKIFIPFFNHETSIMSEECNLSEYGFNDKDSASREKRLRANLECYSAGISVFLDGVETKIDFLKTDHPVTNQFGLQGFVNLAEIAAGSHLLRIVKSVSSTIQKEWEIPFFYSPN